MRRFLGWGLFVAFLVTLTLLLGQILPITPRCVIEQERRHDITLPSFDFLELSGQGQTLLTGKALPSGGYEYSIWPLPLGPSPLQFIIPAGIGIAGILLVWRRRRLLTKREVDAAAMG